MSTSKSFSEPGESSAAGQDPAYAGWVRVDSDNVVRGWATDRNHRSIHPIVDIFIENEWVGSALADRPDPKLRELGEGDGDYAFAMVVPSAFRDGRPHVYDAKVRGEGTPLRKKIETFEILASAPVPAIVVETAGYLEVSGRLSGGQYSKSSGLELWSGDRRLELPLAVHWHGPQGERRFTTTIPDAAFAAGDGPLVLAAPGMLEAGLDGASVAVDTRLSVEIDDAGMLTAKLSGRQDWLKSRTLELRLYAEDGGVAVFSQPIRGRQDLHFVLADALADMRLRANLAVDGREIPRLSATVARVPGRLTKNSAFQAWGEGAPADWTIAAPGGADRGFYAFPSELCEQQGLSGDLVRLEIAGGEAAQPVLRQVFEAPCFLGGVVEAAAMARASGEAILHLRALDPDFAEVGRLSMALPRSWAWVYTAAPVASANVSVAAIELSVEAAADVHVDIAGARLGGYAFRDALEPGSGGVGAEVNTVRNADLRDWPNGVTVTCRPGRHETARDWFVSNPRSTGLVFVAALFDDDASGRLHYAVAAEEASDLCRLEVKLDGDDVAGLDEAVLSFEACAPAPARRLLRQAAAAAPEFVLIDRVLVLRRAQRPARDGFRIADDIVAVVARKLLLTRSPERFDFRMRLDHARLAPEFQPQAGEAPPEFYLVFEFRRTFAASFGDVRLVAAPPPDSVALAGRLSLEDRSISAQIEQTRGLDAWLSPTIQTADADPRPRGAEASRWRWRAAKLGSVEVVVCVHDAIDETIACLDALSTCTEVPHTVQIVDDASSPPVGARLRAYVANRPWMRLVHHAENIGYTGSADAAVRASEADWIVLLNSDTVVTPGWLEGLIEVAASDPAVAFAGPVSNAATFQSVPELYDSAGRFKVNPLPPGWTAADMARVVAQLSEKAFPAVPLLNGFCTLMRRAAFLEIGGFNRGAFPAGYGEENDLCTRATKAGYRLAVADHVYVYHSKSASFGVGRRNELAKIGSRTLKELHPDVDFAVLTAQFRDTPALVRLRTLLRDAVGAPGESAAATEEPVEDGAWLNPEGAQP